MNRSRDPSLPVMRQYEPAEEYGPKNHWRPGTMIKPAPMHFFLNAGGLGDFICYTSAVLWIAEHIPWIHGRLYCGKYLMPMQELLFGRFPKWEIRDGAKVPLDLSEAFTGPELVLNGQNVSHQLCNATGSNLVDLGFQYYANMQAAPPEVTYPHLPKFRPRDVHFLVRPYIGRYVVLTPGAVTPARTTTGKHLNGLARWLVSQGLVPVWLGKDNFADEVNSKFADDIDWSVGIDLRNQTDILQAAAIMEHALCVLGLDNGLLHLASCTEATVLFAYNIATVEHRRPRRTWGRLFDITVSPEELPCIGCQTHGKLMINHTYHKCYYGDTRCIDLLFEDDGWRFRTVIKQILEENRAV